MPEFGRSAIEVMRQPLEEGTVTIARAAGTFTYPARFQLVASMNPCPCGYRGMRNAECHCDDAAVSKYVGKLSGPLLDRIDLQIEIARVPFDDMVRREGALRVLAQASAKRQFSARALDRIARVARTIADLAGSDAILAAHVAEAIQYRSLERLDGRAA